MAGPVGSGPAEAARALPGRAALPERAAAPPTTAARVSRLRRVNVVMCHLVRAGRAGPFRAAIDRSINTGKVCRGGQSIGQARVKASWTWLKPAALWR